MRWRFTKRQIRAVKSAVIAGVCLLAIYWSVSQLMALGPRAFERNPGLPPVGFDFELALGLAAVWFVLYFINDFTLRRPDDQEPETPPPNAD